MLSTWSTWPPWWVGVGGSSWSFFPFSTFIPRALIQKNVLMWNSQKQIVTSDHSIIIKVILIIKSDNLIMTFWSDGTEFFVGFKQHKWHTFTKFQPITCIMRVFYFLSHTLYFCIYLPPHASGRSRRWGFRQSEYYSLVLYHLCLILKKNILIIYNQY